MRKLDRTRVPAPPSLTVPHASVNAEKTQAATYYGSRNPWQRAYVSYSFENYKGFDVKAALRMLANGNCAYCESKIGAVGAREVEHYRPKGGINGLPTHPGYWWLAHDWENLLPTCRDCNKSLRQHIVSTGMTKAQVLDLLSKRPAKSYGKANHFDIRGKRAITSTCSLTAEDPLLIDPCKRDPSNDLRWDFTHELTLIEPALGHGGPSPYGLYTIRTCALNRAELVLDRIPVLLPMKTLKAHILNRLNRWGGAASELQDILEEVKVLASHAEPDQPYAGMAAAYIAEFAEELDKWRVARGLAHF